jgi:hypothetical protein
MNRRATVHCNELEFAHTHYLGDQAGVLGFD